MDISKLLAMVPPSVREGEGDESSELTRVVSAARNYWRDSKEPGDQETLTGMVAFHEYILLLSRVSYAADYDPNLRHEIGLLFGK